MMKEDVKDENNELIYLVDDMVLNDKKEQLFVQSKTGERVWHQTSPDDTGRVGQAVIDPGITLRTHTHKLVSTKVRGSHILSKLSDKFNP
eukprot:9540938-Heterocapsa_arctica.AAC.1